MTWTPAETRLVRRWITVALLLAAIIRVDAWMQSSIRGLEPHLNTLFPEAARFSGKTGTPAHIKVYTDDETLIGFVFSTIDVEPLERGYEGPIEMLVGMDTAGRLRGVDLIAHREPYGYFSIELPKFADQFVGKSILDRFRVGEDVDGVTTATITVSSATRVVRKAARRVAREHLANAENDRP
ncbi:MAG: FMN-binding protein [Vicinamibacterales bacterium]|jgi:transcriptional regulator of nitric oxide reductase|nr:FMN-binding protein [Vicinamibacterales bacterium]MDP6610592.1 FMN-binding protein [Vicinamibacterales bacterium]|tara:strand:+ start:10330 stop:10878 length:549 start_codon:yes stop_codon:yes gene_type:complete